ncbi:MAG: hypothetical protein ACRDJP_00070 [Actinomycetota bacterium]
MIGRRLLLAGLLCLAAACSDERADDVGTPPDAAPAQGTTSPSSEDPSPSTPGATRSPAPEPSSTIAPSDPSTTTATERGDDVAAATFDDDGLLGSMSRAFLDGAVPGVVIEVDTTSGTALTSRARQALADALATHGRKQTVSSSGASTVPSADVYTLADLRRLSATHRATASSADRLSVYVLVLEGRFEIESVTGVAFEASSFALFPDTIGDGLLPAMNYSHFEESVAVHELGHLFGLVDLTGQGAFHEDPEHPGHSASRQSVMYWAVEDVSIGNLFRGGPPTDFDAEDRRELDLIRSGG